MIQFSVCCLTAVRRKEKRFCEAAGETCCRAGHTHGRSGSASRGWQRQDLGSLGHGAPGLGWQQDQCGPISRVAFEQADDSPGCSTMLVRQASKDGVLAAASPQYPNLLDFFLSCTSPGPTGKEVDVTSNHPCSCGSVGLQSLGPCQGALMLKGSHFDSPVFRFGTGYFNGKTFGHPRHPPAPQLYYLKQ